MTMGWQIVILLTLLSMTCGILEVKVGIILISNGGSPYDYERTMGALDVAVEYINSYIFDNTTTILVPIVRKYGPNCDANKAPGICIFYKLTSINFRFIIGFMPSKGISSHAISTINLQLSIG